MAAFLFFSTVVFIFIFFIKTLLFTSTLYSVVSGFRLRFIFVSLTNCDPACHFNFWRTGRLSVARIQKKKKKFHNVGRRLMRLRFDLLSGKIKRQLIEWLTGWQIYHFWITLFFFFLYNIIFISIIYFRIYIYIYVCVCVCVCTVI